MAKNIKTPASVNQAIQDLANLEIELMVLEDKVAKKYEARRELVNFIGQNKLDRNENITECLRS